MKIHCVRVSTPSHSDRASTLDFSVMPGAAPRRGMTSIRMRPKFIHIVRDDAWW